ncbi:MAG: ABC transporter permease [Clostridiales bacterium]|nr:ABC transporter permease [Clostridiales bacterium]MDY4171636.1 ABC transporter permease [Evtepia sp.]
MERFFANLSNELFKLRKRKKYLVFLILGSAICVASALRVLIVNYITDGGVSRQAILGGLMSSNLTFLLLLFLPLMAIMATCDLFVGEQVDHTIRFSLMRPVGKGKIFFSKAAAAFLLCAFDLAVMYVVTTLTQVCLGGGTEGILTSLGASLLDLIPLAVLVLFFSLINQLVKGSSLTVLLCVVCYVGLLILGTYTPAVGGLVFTGYLRWHNLWIGITLPLLSLLPRIGLLAGYGLVFGCCGYLLFDRREA